MPYIFEQDKARLTCVVSPPFDRNGIPVLLPLESAAGTLFLIPNKEVKA